VDARLAVRRDDRTLLFEPNISIKGIITDQTTKPFVIALHIILSPF
jgi:hypothetical protein